MNRWLSINQVLLAWGVLTGCAYVTYVAALHWGPPDELVMASTLSFQAAVGVIVVGIPAVVLLLLALFIGAIAKRWYLADETPEDQKRDAI